MALFRGNSSGSPKTEPAPKTRPDYTCSEPLATTDNYKPSGSDSRHPLTDSQVSDLINGRE